MCVVENGSEFVWFSFHQARRQSLSTLSFLQQVGLIFSCTPLCVFEGYVCLMPKRFFPLFIDKEKGFVLKRWPGAYALLQDHHFRLCPSLQGMQIEQGTGRVYLNGQPIQKALLHDGDWILAGGYSFFWSSPLLLVPSLLADSFHQSLPLYLSKARPLEFASPPSLFEVGLEPTSFQIEPPPLFQDEKMGLSASSGGGMMAISALTSAISSLFLKGQGNQIQGILPALLSAMSFMGFYAWQAKRRQNEKKVANCDALEQYLTYLKEQLNVIESLRQERQTQFIAQKQRIMHFDPSLKHSQCQDSWSLPISLVKIPCLNLEIPTLSWQFQNSPQEKALAQMKEAQIDTLTWHCLHQGQVGFIRPQHLHQLLHLYMLWCWMVFIPTRRFVWIGFPFPSHCHPASLLEGERLYFKTLKDFLACKTRFPNVEWTICVHESLSSQLEPSTLFAPSFFPTSLSSRLESSSQSNSWPQSAHSKETWILCLKEPTFQLGPQIFESLPLFFEPTKPSARTWRQSAYGLSSSQESLVLPHLLQTDFKLDVTSQQLANLKVEIGAGIFWDLKQEGPHALVAGVTGSGKSEGLCSILFQLALQNSAKLLQFVLIDFKGGSFSVPLQDLPHSVACLTNLASQEIVRLEKALQQELDRRQHILSKFLTQHPDCPPDLDHCVDPKTGKMFSHLLICVDEFGQLKARFPDFMKFLQESARIGRSLGLHLILSTQKPAGLVDEQIWANAKTKLCFPVLDGADSREVLGHDGATRLSKSGEFILQVTGESEKKGRAFYLKRAANGTSPLFLKKQGMWREKPTRTLQDAIRKTILARKEGRDPLLIVDPKEKVETFSGIMIDRLTHTESFVLPQGLVIAIGQAQNLETLLSQLTWSCRQANWIVLNASLLLIPDAKTTTLSSLWTLQASQDWHVIILAELERFPTPLLKELLDQKWCTIFLFGAQIAFRQESMLSQAVLKLLVPMNSKDQLALISEGRIRQEEEFPVVQALYPDKMERLIVGKRQPLKKEADSLTPLPTFCLQQIQKDASLFSLLQLTPGLIGVESKSFKPIFLTSRGLTIAWSVASAKEQALNLALRLQLENPLLEVQSIPTKGQVCLLDASKSVDPANALKQAIEEMPVLFLGKGLSTWQYLLQLTLPLETSGNGLYIDKGLGIDVQSATVQDDKQKEG